METIVCKFGGTSMATAKSVEQVEKIIKSNDARRFIVVSAPGKTDKSRKITDALNACFEELFQWEIATAPFPR